MLVNYKFFRDGIISRLRNSIPNMFKRSAGQERFQKSHTSICIVLRMITKIRVFITNYGEYWPLFFFSFFELYLHVKSFFAIFLKRGNTKM